MQLKSNLNHVFTSFSTKLPNNYRIFCGNKQIQSKYIYRFYDIIISPSTPLTALSKAPPPLRPEPTLPKPHYPLLCTIFLAPLSKVRCCRPKKFRRLPEGLPHHYHSLRTNPTNTALSLAQHHILASLVKGRWIDGKAQTVALLLSACDMPTLFILQTFLPSRRRDCRTTIHRSHPTSPTQKIRHLH